MHVHTLHLLTCTHSMYTYTACTQHACTLKVQIHTTCMHATSTCTHMHTTHARGPHTYSYLHIYAYICTHTHTHTANYQMCREVMSYNFCLLGIICNFSCFCCYCCCPDQVIRALRCNINRDVPSDYDINFKKAEDTFLYQMVYDPRSYQQVRLNHLPNDVNPKEFKFAGMYPRNYVF